LVDGVVQLFLAFVLAPPAVGFGLSINVSENSFQIDLWSPFGLVEFE
jgi:hypothetical protein